MRIALIADRFPPEHGGGGTTYAVNLAKGLSKNHDVKVFAMDFGSGETNAKGFGVERLSFGLNPGTSRGFYRFVKNIPKKVSAEGFDVMHCCSPSLAAFMPGKDFVVTAHGTSFGELKAVFFEGSLTIRSLSRIINSYFLELFSLHRAGKVITTSRFLTEEAKKTYLLKKAPSTIYYSVDTEVFKPSKQSTEDFILFSGRLSQRKGIPTLLKALKGLDLKVKFAGEGEMKNLVKKKSENRNFRAEVELSGWLSPEELAEQFRQCAFAVVPSNYEIFGMVNIEAMACGKPVVASNTGGIPEIVENGHNGLLFEPGNAEDLQEKIRFMWQNPLDRKELAHNALASVQRFGMRKFISEHEKVYAGEADGK